MNVNMEWIDLSDDHHGTQETRVRVRSHAMRATAASRRKAAMWGKRNMRQVPEDPVANPVTQGSTHPVLSDEMYTNAIGETYQTHTERGLFWSSEQVSFVPTISPAMPLSGVELLAAETGIHIPDLSALTEIQCGWTACAILASQQNRITDLVSHRKLSYLYCVASRYGCSPCLDEALRCVTIRARRVLVPFHHPFDKQESAQYVAALRSLQKAIDDDQLRYQPDVLCAINLLSLYELLHFTRQEAWALHTAGASRLIQARGPSTFMSDFDIRLMLSMITPITHEFLRNNEACFLEDNHWQQMFQSFVIITESFSLRSQLAISLVCIMVTGPRLVRDVRAVVAGSDNNKHPDVKQLRVKLREYRSRLLQWRAEFDSTVLKTPAVEGTPTPSEDIRSELLATYYGLSIIASRLLCAISTGHIGILEDDAVAYATQMVELESKISPTNNRTSFYIRQKIIVASATLNTTALWREAGEPDVDIIEEDKFEAWWSAIVVLQAFL